MESDGCKITTDLVLGVFQDQLMMLLSPGEYWKPKQQAHSSVYSNENGNEVPDCNEDEVEESLPNVAQQDGFNEEVELQESATETLETHQVQNTDQMATQMIIDIHDDKLSQCFDTALDEVDYNSKCADDPLADFDENQSPNTSKKRSLNAIVVERNKKKVSVDMKFESFEINWSKLSDNLLTELRKKQDFKNKNPKLKVPRMMRISNADTNTLVNIIVDQLRAIDTNVRADTMESVAKQILSRYPCLEFEDDDGFGAGEGYVSLKYKMINRNAYLNRFKDPNKPSTSRSEKVKLRNVRAGTIKEYWTETSPDCTKDIKSMLLREEPHLLTDEFMSKSQAYLRYVLDEKQDLKSTLKQFPIVRCTKILNFHFTKATGVDVSDLRKYYSSKKSKIINYSLTCRRGYRLKNNATDLEVFSFLASLLGENIDNLIIQKEIGTHIDDISIDVAGPVLVCVDLGADRFVYYVYAENLRLNDGADNIIDGLENLMAVYYVHNFMYVTSNGKFLEFVQQYFLKIIPLLGSKSTATRVGRRQRVVRKIITALSEHEIVDQQNK
ncbi:uncharacterized protein LOC131694835 isoform X1 [Topomyia yanbarensis]|uniref:uncharacterized protein LOC131694835 isoform X1 n=2 Tax=Topomyia yanbarensis TaxID=2498891 RepID=UPI00273C4F3D|nr:uncharacterized protein LOC131694835 isoform X1 [Topomyia yanbarensis]